MEFIHKFIQSDILKIKGKSKIMKEYIADNNVMHTMTTRNMNSVLVMKIYHFPYLFFP